MYGLGMMELVIILAVVGLLFGVKRLPEIGKSLGSSIREFKAAGRELRDLVEEDLDDV